MSSFIELRGASGATYRFRDWTDAGATPMAGNFVALEPTSGAAKVLMLGVTTDLSRTLDVVATAKIDASAVFVRLNVSRSTRAAEHEDLVAQYRPEKVFAPGD